MRIELPFAPQYDVPRHGVSRGVDESVAELLRSLRPRPPRVLQLSKFYPPIRGGIETVAWELTEGLNRLGLRTDVMCSHESRSSVSDVEPAGYRVTRVGSMGRVLSTSIAPAMPAMLRRVQADYDLIHLHMPDPMTALSVALARPRARLVVHWHSDVIRQRLAMHAYRHLQDWVLARADAVIATSDAYAASSEVLQRWRDKVRVVPIGISDQRGAVLPDVTAALRARHAGRRIVFSLGRMTHYKGFDVLVDAAALLPDDCVVLIGGDGERAEALRRHVAARGLQHKVELLGHIPDHELASHFAACDVFCMSSTVRAEAYGVAILEAMTMGKPVVATDIAGSGVPWVNLHGVTGLNVPVRDPVGLAQALRRLLDDEALRARFGAIARLRYTQELQADLMTRRTMRLYASLGVGVASAEREAQRDPASADAAAPGRGHVPQTATALDASAPGASDLSGWNEQ